MNPGIPSVVFFSFMAITTFATYHLAKPPFNLSSGELGNLFLVLLIGVFVSPIAGKHSDTIGIGLVTVGMFSVQSVVPTYLGDLVPNDRATLAILYQTFFYFGGALGTLIAALIWKSYYFNGVAIFCISLLLVGIIPLTYSIISRKRLLSFIQA